MKTPIKRSARPYHPQPLPAHIELLTQQQWNQERSLKVDQYLWYLQVEGVQA